MTPLDLFSRTDLPAIELLLALSEPDVNSLSGLESVDFLYLRAEAIEGTAEALEAVGLVTLLHTFGGTSADGTARGRALVSSLREQMGRRSIRIRFAMDELLNWIHDEKVEKDNRRLSYERVKSLVWSRFGFEIAQAEILEAYKRLSDERFIEGPSASGIDGPLFPDLTAKGRHYAEHGISTQQKPYGLVPTQVTNHHISNSGNLNIGGANVHQALSNDWQVSVSELLDNVEKIDVESALADNIASLRSELSGQARPSVVKQLLERLADGASSALGTIGGTMAVPAIQALIAAIG